MGTSLRTVTTVGYHDSGGRVWDIYMVTTVTPELNQLHQLPWLPESVDYLHFTDELLGHVDDHVDDVHLPLLNLGEGKGGVREIGDREIVVDMGEILGERGVREIGEIEKERVREMGDRGRMV